MTHTLHITRKAPATKPGGPPVSLVEWLAYLDADPEMQHVGFAEVETPAGDRHPVSTGLAVWLGYSHHDEGHLAWFDHNGDHVTVSNPDAEIIRKMQRIAATLSAHIEGEHGERYDADGREVTA